MVTSMVLHGLSIRLLLSWLDCVGNSQCRAPSDPTHAIFDAAAETIEAAGFTVIREPIEGTRDYKGHIFDTNYMNWLVGNGFVITVGFDNPETDEAAKVRLERYFSGPGHLCDRGSRFVGSRGVVCIVIPTTSQRCQRSGHLSYQTKNKVHELKDVTGSYSGWYPEHHRTRTTTHE